MQKLSSLEAIYTAAPAVFNQLSTLLEWVGAAAKAEVKMGSIKKKERAQEKMDLEYEGDARRLLDVVRGSLVVDRVTDVDFALMMICAAAKVLRVKNRFQNPVMGYRDILLNIELSGMVVEIQIHLRTILDVKKAAHAIYERVRVGTAQEHEIQEMVSMFDGAYAMAA